MDITCPYCGTSYTSFQSNCSRCGAPLPAPSQLAAAAARRKLQMPPDPPREISSSYAWKLMLTDGWAIAAFVLLIIGLTFTLTGGGLTLGIVTAVVGLPFLCLGLGFLGGGGYLFFWRFQLAQDQLGVLRHGQSTVGEITEVHENVNVTVNGYHPWDISYKFELDGQEYTGSVSTLNAPSEALRPGNKAAVLYLPDKPQHNGLYPHP